MDDSGNSPAICADSSPSFTPATTSGRLSMMSLETLQTRMPSYFDRKSRSLFLEICIGLPSRPPFVTCTARASKSSGVHISSLFRNKKRTMPFSYCIEPEHELGAGGGGSRSPASEVVVTAASGRSSCGKSLV